jgi:hypothetical protein
MGTNGHFLGLFLLSLPCVVEIAPCLFGVVEDGAESVFASSGLQCVGEDSLGDSRSEMLFIRSFAFLKLKIFLGGEHPQCRDCAVEPQKRGTWVIPHGKNVSRII